MKYPYNICPRKEELILKAAHAWICKRLTEGNDLDTFESLRELQKEIEERLEYFQNLMVNNCSQECVTGAYPYYCPCGCIEIPKEKHKP